LNAPQEPRALVTECLEAIVGVARLVQRPQACLWSELDLSMGQLKAVFALTGDGPLSVGHLAHLLTISEPAASVLVDRLQGAELAARERDPADKRKTRVVPTAKAVALSERLLQVKEERLGSWLDRLADADLRALLQGLTALAAAASATGSAASAGATSASGSATSAAAAPTHETPAPASPKAARGAVRT
jgi:MarR family transcriptional regulator, organic hydroperoxide resistance regulator